MTERSGASVKLESIREAIEAIESDRPDVLRLARQLLEVVKMLERVAVGDLPIDNAPWPDD